MHGLRGGVRGRGEGRDVRRGAKVEAGWLRDGEGAARARGPARVWGRLDEWMGKERGGPAASHACVGAGALFTRPVLPAGSSRGPETSS